MQKGGSKILAGVKYVYLIFFFALLSGMFYPIIENGANANQVAIGVMILFVGLAGALCLYKAGTSEKRQRTYLIAGFAILSIALLLVFSAAGRL
ncbi:MAG TPA: hypothetical protein VLB45_01675 [Nitrosopumilaceae archaeon]|nr:hypothetical protein [Nitrosopumilaceae archaeon]